MAVMKRTWGQIRKSPKGYIASKGTEEKVRPGYWIPYSSKTKTKLFKTKGAATRFVGKRKKKY